MAISVGGMRFEVDHVAFGAHDLEDAMGALAKLGLSHTPVGIAEWPGREGPRRARTLSVMLEDGYIDVIEADDTGRDHEAVFAPTGVVLRSHDLEAARTRLMRAGVRCGRPYPIARRFDGANPDQDYRIFGTAALHAGLPLSLIQTAVATRMTNESDHRIPVSGVADAAAVLGVAL